MVYVVCSLESYSALMNEATDVLLLKLAAAAKKNCVVDLYKLIGCMTLQVVGTTAFGCGPSFCIYTSCLRCTGC